MKATRINSKQAQGLINNEEERFNDQPVIINNGNRVFEGVDIYELANNLRETFDF